MFAIKLHSNFLKRVKLTKTVDFCIMLHKKGTQVDKSTDGYKWIDITHKQKLRFGASSTNNYPVRKPGGTLKCTYVPQDQIEIP